jgi:hypothetical protein
LLAPARARQARSRTAVSRSGNVTVTVRQADGSRFKTLERSVQPLA